jgi:hypothetical protein
VAFAALLERGPTGAELDSWVARQGSGTAHRDLLGELLTSGEYAARIVGD